jgi:acetyl-CoA C-acetyltransferase
MRPGATTINKVCGSGMKATMLAHDIINAGSAEIVVSGGMESMSNAPYLLAKARGGYRAGHDRIIDHMMMDGLEDAYEVGRSMGDFGEATAEAYQFSRKDQDTYAMETLTRARKAVEGGAFKAEIVPLTVTEKAGPRTIGNDEIPLKVDPRQDSRIEAGVPRQRHHHAGGLLGQCRRRRGADLARRSLTDRDGLPALAEIKGTPPTARNRNGSPRRRSRRSASCSTRSAGASAMSICSRSTRPSRWCRWRRSAISAFPREKLNINGGACALGHPIGATGARLIVTLLHALEAQNLKRGVAALCIGGGEATAIAIDRASRGRRRPVR